MQRFELRRQICNEDIDLKVGPAWKIFLTDRTLAGRCGVPVGLDTGHAEVVPTWSGNWFSEDVKTDGTQ